MSTNIPPVPPASGGLARSQRLVAALVVALALVTGIIAGVAIDRGVLMGHHRGFPPPGGRRHGTGFGFEGPPGPGGRPSDGPPGPRRGRREEIQNQLGLTPAQKAQVDSIMDRRMAQRRVLEDSLRRRMHVFFDSTRAEVDKVLTAEQREKLKTLFPPPPDSGPRGR
jgi:Spy/CpxP family protein refolding chaperone